MYRSEVFVYAGIIMMLVLRNTVSGQNILVDDTCFIGTSSGGAGQHIEVPVYMRTTEYYQGWTIPLSFGAGSSPVVCDSVSLVGTIMESWAWTSTFINNNQWDNVQTCGATGIYVWYGDSLDPGYYLALRLFFTIDANAQPQSISIDTTTCSFAAGGQQNGYIVVVHTQSWLTTVIPGSIVITEVSVEDIMPASVHPVMSVTPTIIRQGSYITIQCEHAGHCLDAIALYDIQGQMVDRIGLKTQNNGRFSCRYSTHDLNPGIYFVRFPGSKHACGQKIVIE